MQHKTGQKKVGGGGLGERAHICYPYTETGRKRQREVNKCIKYSSKLAVTSHHHGNFIRAKQQESNPKLQPINILIEHAYDA